MKPDLSVACMSAFHPIPRYLLPVTGIYALIWVIATLGQLAGWTPAWLTACVVFVSLPLGLLWLRWARDANAPRLAMAIVGSLLYPFWWHAAVVGAEALG